MSNPNNCNTCEYKALADVPGAWCYMFRGAPVDVCMQHTGRALGAFAIDATEPTRCPNTGELFGE